MRIINEYEQATAKRVIVDGFMAGKSDRAIVRALAEVGIARGARTVQNTRQALGLVRKQAHRNDATRTRATYDREMPRDKYLKQDAAFCAAMRAAPECPPRYRN